MSGWGSTQTLHGTDLLTYIGVVEKGSMYAYIPYIYILVWSEVYIYMELYGYDIGLKGRFLHHKRDLGIWVGPHGKDSRDLPSRSVMSS